MSKESGDGAKTVGLVTVNGVVVLHEGLLKEVGPQSIDFGQSLSNKSIEFLVCRTLRAGLNDHVWEFNFEPRRQRDFHEHVATGLGRSGIVNGEVDAFA